MNHRVVLRRAAVLVATGVATAAVLAPAPTQAAVRGSVSMTGERPVSGFFELPYKNYSGQVCGQWAYTQYGAYCLRQAYRVSKGTAEIKLRTYQIAESMDNYDYYLADVEVYNPSRDGSSTGGWMQVSLDQVGTTKIVDHGDSVTKSSDKPDCTSIYPSFGAGWGGAAAGVSFDPITFCGKGSSVAKDSVSGLHTRWTAHNLRAIKQFMTERIVKVPRGAHPTFKVTVTVPQDSCTSAADGYCFSYTNVTYTTSWNIGTTGA